MSSHTLHPTVWFFWLLDVEDYMKDHCRSFDIGFNIVVASHRKSGEGCVRAMPKCRVIQTVDLVPSSGAMDTSLLVRGHAAREGIEMKHRREKSMRASDIPYFQLLCHITPWKDLDSRAYIEVCLALSRIHDDDARKQCHCIRFFQHETYTQRRKVGFSHIRSQGMMWIS